MFVKLTVLACSLAVACGVWTGPLAGGLPAAQYPAGVSPQACPNFPHCANPAVAANPTGAQGGWNNPSPQWNNYNPAPVPQWGGHQSALDRGDYTGDGDYRGEGLAESGAYGNQNGGGQWNNGGNNWNNGGDNGQWNNGGQWGNNGGNNAQWNSGKWAGNNGVGNDAGAAIPAGVDPHSCPNYPFCHA